MTSTAARNVQYLAAVQLADRAIQMQVQHQRAEATWATERSGLLNEIDRAEADWEIERSDFLKERTRLLCVEVDLGIDKAVLYTANEKLQKEKADLQAIVEKLQAENVYLRTEQPLCKEPLHISAAHRVFSIPELLEQILLQVPHLLQDSQLEEMCSLPFVPDRPVAQLFALQRVNRHFAAVIAASPALQTRMGLVEFSERRVCPPGLYLSNSPRNYAADTGPLLRKAAMTCMRKTRKEMRSHRPWLGMPLLVSSWARIKVNLYPGHQIYETFREDLLSMRRTYRHAVKRSTTWGDLVWWMILAREDFFERKEGLRVLRRIEADVFA